MTDDIIEVENLTKIFKLPKENYSTAKQRFVNIFKPTSYERFVAVRDVSFKVKRGEFFGIIGANGSGKSTLLKLLAGIYQPTKGKIQINGSLSPFIELGVGFNPELTARENVFLNAAILGLSKKETEEKFDEIIDFSELGEFLDQKLKNFSSGMQVRLAFSIALQAKADILLVDEVLAVGDTAFQQKCLSVFKKLKSENTTVIFVSHALDIVEEFCDRVMVIHEGRNKFIGKVANALLHYLLIANDKKLNIKTSDEKVVSGVKIINVEILDKNGIKKGSFITGEQIEFRIFFESKREILNPVFGLAIHNLEGIHISGANTKSDKITLERLPRKGSISLKINDLYLNAGKYFVTVGIFDSSATKAFDFKEKSYAFIVHTPEDLNQGLVQLKRIWGKIETR